MPRGPLVLGAVLLIGGALQARAADSDYPWAAAARALAPPGWIGGQVIGHDARARTGVIALYPRGDADPTTRGKALEVGLDTTGHPVSRYATLRDRRPAEHLFFDVSGASPPGDDDIAPAPGLPAGTTPCRAGGWTSDPDPHGLNLRAEPSRRGKVVATLPRLAGPYGIEFRIVGFRDGWFLIEKANDPGYDPAVRENRNIYAGRGWVAGALVMSSVASPDLMSSPHEDAGVVLKLSGRLGDTAYGPDSVPLRRILACNRRWILVEVEDPPTRARHTGWVERLCSNQVTTCP